MLVTLRGAGLWRALQVGLGWASGGQGRAHTNALLLLRGNSLIHVRATYSVMPAAVVLMPFIWTSIA